MDLKTWKLPNNTVDQQVTDHYDYRGRIQSITDYRDTTFGFEIESGVTQISKPR